MCFVVRAFQSCGRSRCRVQYLPLPALQAQELRQALERAESTSRHLREEASGLRAKGELLRIERDSATARVSRLEEEGREREAAREAEKEELVSCEIELQRSGLSRPFSVCLSVGMSACLIVCSSFCLSLSRRALAPRSHASAGNVPQGGEEDGQGAGESQGQGQGGGGKKQSSDVS